MIDHDPRSAAAAPAIAQSARQTRSVPRLLQSDWRRALFIHYEVDPAVLQPLVPFALDLCEGRAYVSLVAFTMERLRPVMLRRWGAWLMSPIGTHPFLNVRTYVRHHGEAGIYFLAEWLPNRISVQLGPPMYGLPYRHGWMRFLHDHECGCLSGVVIAQDGAGTLAYRGTLNETPAWQPCRAGSFDEFVIERYSAFTQHRSVNRVFRITHKPWPVSEVRVRIDDDRLLAATGGWPASARLIGGHYSPGVHDVAIGPPQRVAP